MNHTIRERRSNHAKQSTSQGRSPTATRGLPGASGRNDQSLARTTPHRRACPCNLPGYRRIFVRYPQGIAYSNRYAHPQHFLAREISGGGRETIKASGRTQRRKLRERKQKQGPCSYITWHGNTELDPPKNTWGSRLTFFFCCRETYHYHSKYFPPPPQPKTRLNLAMG